MGWDLDELKKHFKFLIEVEENITCGHKDLTDVLHLHTCAELIDLTHRCLCS